MDIKSYLTDGVLTISLTGELDHHGAAAVRREIDKVIESVRPKKVVLMLDRVGFCDSSGLGLIMGRYKKAQSVGAELCVGNPSDSVVRIIALAGLDKLIKTERSDR